VRREIAVLLIAASMGLPTAGRAADELKVVVSIKPLHALVTGVMTGVGSPRLLVDGPASPHTYALKPSDARVLNQADLFFRMSEVVEPFTVRIVRSLPKSVEVVTLLDTAGLTLLGLRTGATFERVADKTGHGAHGDHSPQRSDPIDGHVWLDPGNARTMVERIRGALTSKDAANAAAYRRNADALRLRLDALEAELQGQLAPVAAKPYVVFHDAFQYFERRFGLNVVGSISISPEIPPSGKRLTELRRRILASGAMCVFAEPQFDRRLVQNLVEGTNARIGTLDPEGGTLPPGPDLYFVLMRRLAEDLRGCLAAPA
jgi:zinc transport system substrate-binding protein